MSVPNEYGGEITGYINDKNELSVILEGCDDGSIGNKIKYVHQLQNLYFALTGEELILSK